MMKKIAYITEKKPGEKIDGGNIQDTKMLKLLYQLGEVKLYYADVQTYYKYEYIWNNNHKPAIIDEINNIDFNVVIITAYQTSPFLMGYRRIKHKKYFWLRDSAFLMRKNTNFFNIKYKMVNTLLASKERNLIKHEQCAYLGNDEINSLPKKYRKNAVVFPFHIAVKQKNYFDKTGHVLYMGQFSYWTNREAFYKILRIAPRITGKIKIFGLNIPKINTVPPNVELVGYVESLDDAYIGAKALIYPISCGTGIKNKVIEAMSYGIPVIGFRNAFTNMNVEHNKNCIIVRKTAEIIDGLNRADLGVISENARLFIEREMSEEHALSCVKKYI
jgi:glycosyltransferase involved in cell wall biosynthesis